MKKSLLFLVIVFVLAVAVSTIANRRSTGSTDRSVVTAETTAQDDARFVSYNFNKAQFLPGENVSVTIEMANTGTQNWEASRVALWPYGGQNSWLAKQGWSLGQSLVRPGERTTITMNFPAPSTAQTAGLQWVLMRDGGFSQEASFGPAVPERPLVFTVVEPPSAVINHAPTIRAVSWEPQPIVIDKSVQFSWIGSDVDYERLAWSVDWNNGSSITSGDGFCSQATECQPTLEQRFKAEHTWKRSGMHTVTIKVTDVAGASATNTVTIDIPNPGVRDNAEFVGGSFPQAKRFYVNSVVPLTLTMRNTGSTIWKASEKNIFLYPFPFDNADVAAWGASKGIPITHDVGLGQTYTFTLGDVNTMIAPSQADRYQLQWHLYRWTDTSDVSTRTPFGQSAPGSALEYTVANMDGTSPIVDLVSFQGPSTVTVGQAGTWTLQATYPSNTMTDGAATYTSSVVWQDRQVDTSAISLSAGAVRTTQSTSFSHAYETPGRYEAQLYMTNDQNIVVARASVGIVVAPLTQEHPDGSLIKSSGSATVYRIEAGSRRPFLTGHAFESRGHRWSDVIAVASDALHAYPLGAPISDLPLSNGFLLKSPNRPEVYWTQNGQKQHIANEAVFKAHAFRWQDIYVVTEDALAAYPTGPDMSR